MMSAKKARSISPLDFRCNAPLRFFEHCANCTRFAPGCPDLALAKELLRGKKTIVYGDYCTTDTIRVTAFNCLTPLHYFERTRKKSPRAGRCREEGMLLALLDGKMTLEYTGGRKKERRCLKCTCKVTHEAA